MAAVSTILLGAGLALAAGQAAMSISAANQAEKAANNAALEQRNYAYEELGRQQTEVREIAAEKKGERARQADHEMASLRVLMAERGGLQTNTFQHLTSGVGAAEGRDFGKLAGNERREIEALQSKKNAARMNALQSIEATSRQAMNARIGAGLQFGANAISAGRGFMKDRAIGTK